MFGYGKIGGRTARGEYIHSIWSAKGRSVTYRKKLLGSSSLLSSLHIHRDHGRRTVPSRYKPSETLRVLSGPAQVAQTYHELPFYDRGNRPCLSTSGGEMRATPIMSAPRRFSAVAPSQVQASAARTRIHIRPDTGSSALAPLQGIHAPRILLTVTVHRRVEETR